MTTLRAAMRAQVSAELRSRLRSPATAAAVLFLVVGSWLWLPPAEGRAVSLSWRTVDGALESPRTTAAALGVGVALLLAVFFLLAAFYLVVGSLARDRRLGIGVIVAATPTSGAVFLVGRLAAHAAYLGALSLVAFAVGLAAFVERGVGPLDLAALLTPSFLVLPGGLLLVPALALCFETVPILRSRAGLVLWLLVGLPLLAAAPAALSGAGPGRVATAPAVDPLGAITLQALITQSLPQAAPGTVSSGLVLHETAPRRVPWPGIVIAPRILVARAAAAAALAAVPLALAVLLFDRFDPASGRRRRERAPTPLAAPGTAVASVARYADLPPVAPCPGGWWRAVIAESALIVRSLRWRRWLLAAAAVAPVLAPAAARPPVAILFLVVLAVALGDVGAREALHGTRPLVLAQPGVPRPLVLWKASAAALVAVACGLPLLLVASLAGPASALAALCGLLTLAVAATALGLLTGGTRLFLGILTLLAYLALQGFAPADFAGVTGAPLAVPAGHLALACLLGVAAHARQRGA